MTVFTNLGIAAKPSNTFYRTGKNLRTVNSKFTITAAASTNGDVFVLAGPLTTEMKVQRILAPVGFTGFTSANDNDFGFHYYKDGTLTAIDADILVDGGDMSSSLVSIDLLSLNSSLDKTSTIGDLLSLTPDNTYAGGIYLTMTMNTASTLTTGPLDLDVQIECPTA